LTASSDPNAHLPAERVINRALDEEAGAYPPDGRLTSSS